MDGDTLAIGANKDDTAAGFNAGSVYIYTRTGTIWKPQVKLEAFDAEATDQYGRSVCVRGDNLIVGAIFDDADELIDTGSAYLYTRSDGLWSLNRKFVPADAGEGDLLGYTVAVDGDDYVAGSYLHDPDGVMDAGAAFVLELGARSYCTAGVSASGCQCHALGRGHRQRDGRLRVHALRPGRRGQQGRAVLLRHRAGGRRTRGAAARASSASRPRSPAPACSPAGGRTAPATGRSRRT